MKYSVKMIIRHSIESGEVFLEESVIMTDADSFDDAYLKAERYVKDNEINCSYKNMYGKHVKSEVVSYADCFLVFDDEEVTEVYSATVKCCDDLNEDIIADIYGKSCSREEMLPLRRWADPDRPDEVITE